MRVKRIVFAVVLFIMLTVISVFIIENAGTTLLDFIAFSAMGALCGYGVGVIYITFFYNN